MRRHLASLLPRAQGIAASCRQPTQAAVVIATRGFADDANLKKTVLYDFHVEHGGASQCHEGTTAPSPPRQDGALCWVVNADTVQRLDHGLVQVVPQQRLPL